MVLILESRTHLDLGDLPNLLAAELGVMTVRLERAIRSLDDVARVHVNRWGDGSAHLHMWFLARPYGRLQLRGTFLSLWDSILPPISEAQWRENLALVAAWLAEFGGRPLAEPPRIQWQAPSSLLAQSAAADAAAAAAEAVSVIEAAEEIPEPSPESTSGTGPDDDGSNTEALRTTGPGPADTEPTSALEATEPASAPGATEPASAPGATEPAPTKAAAEARDTERMASAEAIEPAPTAGAAGPSPEGRAAKQAAGATGPAPARTAGSEPDTDSGEAAAKPTASPDTVEVDDTTSPTTTATAADGRAAADAPAANGSGTPVDGHRTR
ncbi:hypothetical protein [Micromonospora sp. 067-2]|uniref:hypothetical protein n=1 Tax=Micromonospora sp. 067-2 TaxID=2789270 RepID=UPI00397E3145